MTSVEANGITIEYEETGTGEALVLIMGLSGQLIDWPERLPATRSTLPFFSSLTNDVPSDLLEFL